MSTRNITDANRCTKWMILVSIILCSSLVHGSWSVDFSRRQEDIKRLESQRSIDRAPASHSIMRTVPTQNVGPEGGFLGGLFEASGPIQEVVILNTKDGFVPSTLRLHKNGQYQVRVVNINESHKNASFILDAFSEHHGTYFGQLRSFDITPKAEGVFSFHCPETGAEGKIVVTEGQRQPASQ